MSEDYDTAADLYAEEISGLRDALRRARQFVLDASVIDEEPTATELMAVIDRLLD